MTIPEIPGHAANCPVPCCGPTGDPEIPEGAVEPVAKAIYEAPHDGLSRNGYDAAPRDIQDLYRLEARLAIAAALPHLRVQETPMTEEERGFVELALQAVDAGDAGHWPTVAGYLADEVRRLRATPAPRQADDDACQGNQRGSGKPCDCPGCAPRPVVDREALAAELREHEFKVVGSPGLEGFFCRCMVEFPEPGPDGYYGGPFSRHLADAILALLPTEEEEGS